MMNREKQLKLLKKYLSGSRLKHSLNTEKTAIKLASIYDVNIEKAAMAGLMHDIAKDLSKSEKLKLAKKNGIKPNKLEELSPELLHGKLGALILKENGVKSKKVLAAIENHTMGEAGMSTLDKIVYLADLIEPSRKFKGIKRIRFYATRDLDIALFESMKLSLSSILKNDKPIHPKTIKAYNNLLIENLYSKRFL